jgi:hypothetical protein
MTVEELKAKIAQAQEQGVTALVLVAQGRPSGLTKRVLGQNARVLAVNNDGTTVVLLNVEKLERWLAKQEALLETP